jgi:predicted RNase H-like HicB family nuclease
VQHRKAGGHQVEVNVKNYIAYLHKDSGSDFGVSFPDFPGCITAGKTLEEAQHKAAEALRLQIAGMLEDGEKIPKPSTIDDIADDPNANGAVAFLVSAYSERTVRINITARESQIEQIDVLARNAGLTRSAFLVQAAFQRIPKIQRAMTAGSVHRKAAPTKAARAKARTFRKASLKTAS